MATKEEKPERVYWDACVFIHRFDPASPHKGTLSKITDLAERGKIQIATSVLTITEISRPRDNGKPLSEAEVEKLVRFFDNPFLLLRQIDRNLAALAGFIARSEVRAGRNIKNPDALHLATALLAQADSFCTYDDRLLKKDGLIPLVGATPQQGGAMPTLKIHQPALREEKAEPLSLFSLIPAKSLTSTTVAPKTEPTMGSDPVASPSPVASGRPTE